MKILYHHHWGAGWVVGRKELARHLAALHIALRSKAIEYTSPARAFEYNHPGTARMGPAQPRLTETFTDVWNAVLFDPEAAGGMAGAHCSRSPDDPLRRRVGDNPEKTIGNKFSTWRWPALRAIELFKRTRGNA